MTILLCRDKCCWVIVVIKASVHGLQVLPSLRSVWVTASAVKHEISISTVQSEIFISFHGANSSANLEYRIPLSFQIQDSPSEQGDSVQATGTAATADDFIERRFVIGDDSEQLLKAAFFGLSGHRGRLGRCYDIAEGQEREMLQAVHCGTCGAALVRTGGFRRVLPLPSPFWHEFAELSICHEDFRYVEIRP